MSRKVVEKKIIAYKGFNKDMTCRGMQFEEGKEYTYYEDIEICNKGFHACIDPKDCLRYYPADTSVYHKVELTGLVKLADYDSKICASKIKILERVNILDEIIKSGRYSDYFKKGEETSIDDSFLGIIKNKNDWDKIKKENTIHIGNRIIILDGEYNSIWRCIEKLEDGSYYFMSEGIGYYPIETSDFEINHFNTSWVYNKVLIPLGENIKKIFDSSLKVLKYGDNGDEVTAYSTLARAKDVCCTHIKDNFTYFKILNILDIFYQYNRASFWLRSVASSSRFAFASGSSGIDLYDDADNRNYLRPFINIG